MVNRVINNPWYYPQKRMVGLLLGLPHCVYLSNLGQILLFSSGRLLHVKLFEWTLKTPHWPKQHSWVPRHAQVNDHDMRDPQSAAAFHHGEVPNCSMTQPLGDHDPTASTAACELLPWRHRWSKPPARLGMRRLRSIRCHGRIPNIRMTHPLLVAALQELCLGGQRRHQP